MTNTSPDNTSEDISASRNQKPSQYNAALKKALAVPETAVLISPWVRYGIDAHTRQAESIALVQALGLDLRRALKPRLAQIHAGNYLSAGVIERLKVFIAEHHTDLVVVDASISPVQQRNLERALHTRVIDRHGLILEIFASRARSHEGRLQVELANLKFQESRLVRSWTHLERQRGGLGTVGGPGESQLEIDRRLLRQQIHVRERKIAALEKRRTLQRTHRQSGQQRQVALIGYTNAGKTSLFNRLTGAQQSADKRVFETLDTTLRRWMIAPGSHVVIGDTVGFIDDLPPDLIHAFRATLEEILYADLIIHLHDYHAPESMIRVVQDIVEDILSKVNPADRPPVLLVYSKCDTIAPETREKLLREGYLAVSAYSGDNLDILAQQVQHILEGQSQHYTLRLNADEGPLLAWLYRHAEVIDNHLEGEQIALNVRLSAQKHQQMQRKFSPACLKDNSKNTASSLS